jgi:hypothetical protein
MIVLSYMTVKKRNKFSIFILNKAKTIPKFYKQNPKTMLKSKL